MRVTKTIKTYIERRVNEVYGPKIDAVWVEYRAKREYLEGLLDSLLEKVNADARDTLADTGFSIERWGCEQLFSRYGIEDKEWKDSLYQKERELKKERDGVIENIVLTLELGGNREELEKMLGELN